MADKIQFRRDTAARWSEVNPILLSGEIGLVTDSVNKYKLGDGVHAWNELPLQGFNGNLVDIPGTDSNSAMSQKGATDLVSEYNVSINNNNTEYTFAQAVALVPASLQKGGLTIKYIDSTTHEYVIKRLISSTWNTAESNWQGIDDDIPKITNSSAESDLDITDENNHILARFKDGHFQTKEFNSREVEKTSHIKIDFLSKVLACKYSGNLMHISFDDTSSCISTLFSTTPSSIYDIPFFNNLKSLHTTYGACFSCYVYVESLANVNNNYASEFQAAKNWLKWNFHTLNDKQYTSSIPINDDYDLGIQRLLTMCGNDKECLDGQMRANYWELSLDNALFVRNNPIHKSFIFCAKDAFSPSTGNYYLNDFQKQFVFNNGLLLDTNNQIIFIQTCGRLDSDDYVNQSKNLIQTNIKWQKSCEILNHERNFDLTRITNFLQWAKETMGFQFGFFDNIYKII